MDILLKLSSILVFFAFGCSVTDIPNHKNRNSKVDLNPIIKLQNSPITSVTTDWSIKLDTKHLQSNLSLLAEYRSSIHEIRILDVSKDLHIKTIKIPEDIANVRSISLYDEGNLVFITDSIFYLYRNDSIIRFDYAVFNEDYIPLPYINIIYDFPNQKIIGGVLSYNRREKDEKAYSSYFLSVFDLKLKTSKILPLKYPTQFHDNNLGIPRFHINQWKSKILVSFALSDSIYVVDLKDDSIESILVKSNYSNIKDAAYPKNGQKEDKMDAILRNITNIGGYGPVFFDTEGEFVYRVFRPGLPEKDSIGNYYTNRDSGCILMKMNLKTGELIEAKLPNGQYFVNDFWTFNPFNNSLVYPKISEHVSKKNLCFYNFHSITFYNR